jgi:hypothetical protein
MKYEHEIAGLYHLKQHNSGQLICYNEIKSTPFDYITKNTA